MNGPEMLERGTPMLKGRIIKALNIGATLRGPGLTLPYNCEHEVRMK
jgi:hypothetical protein